METIETVGTQKPKKHIRLSYKRKKFIQEYVKNGGNATQAVLNSYKTMSPVVAKSMGSEILANPYVKKSIDEYLEEAGYNPLSSIGVLAEIQHQGKDKKLSASDSIRAAELLLKLSGYVVERKQVSKVTVTLDTMNKSELLKRKQKYDQWLKEHGA